MSTADRLAALRAAPGPVQVVGYSPAEIAERALAEALAAARALGRLWRRRASRARRVEALAAMGVELETPPPSEAESRSIVDALIKTTLMGGFRVARRATGGWMSSGRDADHEPFRCVPRLDEDDHEPFPLTRRIPSSSHGERRSGDV